jgi:hypothetical protein
LSGLEVKGKNSVPQCWLTNYYTHNLEICLNDKWLRAIDSALEYIQTENVTTDVTAIGQVNIYLELQCVIITCPYIACDGSTRYKRKRRSHKDEGITSASIYATTWFN